MIRRRSTAVLAQLSHNPKLAEKSSQKIVKVKGAMRHCRLVLTQVIQPRPRTFVMSLSLAQDETTHMLASRRRENGDQPTQANDMTVAAGGNTIKWSMGIVPIPILGYTGGERLCRLVPSAWVTPVTPTALSILQRSKYNKNISNRLNRFGFDLLK